MSHVSPARFDAKTDKESKRYGLNWSAELGTDTIASAAWESMPAGGLTFTNQQIDGASTYATIGGGVAGTTYYVRCYITLAGTGEVLEAASGDSPGINLEVLGFPVVSGGLGTLRDDYGRGPY